MSPLLSIITVTFNASEVIDRTLSSICRQKDDIVYELIIIDGASTDDTIEKIKKHESLNPIIVSEPDAGIYDAMNKGLKIAQGQYVMFLNAGDSLKSDNVFGRFNLMSQTSPAIIYGQTDIVDKHGELIGPRHLRAPIKLNYKSFANGMLVCHQAMFTRRDIIEPYDLRFRYSADYEWCLRNLRKSDSNVYIGDEPIIDYLNEGITTLHHIDSLKERYKIMSENFGTLTTIFKHIGFFGRAIKRKLKL